MKPAPLKLKKDRERRLHSGHCWVFSNEVDISATPLTDFEPGQPVEIISHRGKWLGTGYVNAHSLICARLVSRDREHPLSQSLLVHRLKVALGLRERLYSTPFYRLVFGESDGLPGLIVDRYGDQVVIQITTAGMERIKSEIVASVEKVLRPAGVLLRNDTSTRGVEGLESTIETVVGDVPEWLTLEENGTEFQISLKKGQKTGWFYDQRENRRRMLKYISGKRVLDVCSYTGSWGVAAARNGAREVHCVDLSAPALEQVGQNAERNGVADRIQVHQGEAFAVLKALRQARERFDVVLLDPPAFIKRRKDQKEGELAYRRLNQAGMQVLERDGVLVSSSCSHHMSGEKLLSRIQQGARHLERSLQLLESGQQGMDHPIHPAIPETAYLKSYFLRVLPVF
ncbi:MAG: SAM-dependent methyltransferase [Gammaproteobacteria bacterium (ex Lamellibrachia satsuma)]|nr:MAG: class I SAM-dependent rRNA methyltransferase [Gammaproteobacteria bacterium (ex Lamellibrachia satsuma)]RRS33150.1 MAG: SAM-dependent methyltransferase [Gammaproteobacteria bacterium (ex Lamellibrachia satsuma)]RRS36295.1 MAG: SAM-dependent methyltransferase [Gammaproteobacteria bacterium (ex Lamellibrachia satsuma)]